MRLEQLKTPAALIQKDRLEANCRRMGKRIRELGVDLRPHVKSHKCAEVARLQVEGHPGGITVSTLAEARFFAENGFDDVTWAFPLVPERLDEVAELSRRVNRLNLLLDHPTALTALDAYGTTHGLRFPVFLEVDCGDHRGGVDPMSDDATEIARALAAADAIDFRGLLTHAGHSYAAKDREAIARVAVEERDMTVTLATRLRQAGVAVDELSVGSTPTMTTADDLTGITEARPGNYVFFDAFQAAIGSCSLDAVAFSILATIVGSYPARRTLVVNAGTLAISKDPGPCHVDPDCGYGVVCSPAGTPIPGLKLDNLSQEHGEIHLADDADADAFPVGSHLRIIPNHCCTAAAAYDRYHLLEGDQVVDEWRPAKGW